MADCVSEPLGVVDAVVTPVGVNVPDRDSVTDHEPDGDRLGDDDDVTQCVADEHCDGVLDIVTLADVVCESVAVELADTQRELEPLVDASADTVIVCVGDAVCVSENVADDVSDTDDEAHPENVTVRVPDPDGDAVGENVGETDSVVE